MLPEFRQATTCSDTSVFLIGQVITPFRNLVLCAATRSEMKGWVSAMRAAASKDFREVSDVVIIIIITIFFIVVFTISHQSTMVYIHFPTYPPASYTSTRLSIYPPDHPSTRYIHIHPSVHLPTWPSEHPVLVCWWWRWRRRNDW